MGRDYEPIDSEETTRRSLIRVLLIVGIAFLGGLIAMGWFLVNYGGSMGILAVEAAAETSEESGAAVAALERRIDRSQREGAETSAAESEPAAEPGSVEERLAAIERRITQLHSSGASAAGNADRAEGLLVAFAARRALDRGVALGYIEGLLRERFGRVAPEAVARIIAASQQPVTLDGLQSRLNELGPALTGRGGDEGWWTAFRREMSELFVVRREGTPSPAPSDRLQRARDKLAVGQVDTALAEVLRLPGREAAEPWIADARRYIAARTALDRIETVALMEPRVNERQRQRAANSSAANNAQQAHGDSRS